MWARRKDPCAKTSRHPHPISRNCSLTRPPTSIPPDALEGPLAFDSVRWWKPLMIGADAMFPRPSAPAAIDDRHCPTQEAARLAALRSCGMIGAGSDAGLDRIVRLTASSLRMPIAWVSLIDEEFSWLVARIGVDLQRMPRHGLPCERIIARSDVVVVNEGDGTPGHRDGGLFRDLPDVRFHAGAPLITGDGHRIGSLCVLDTEPHAEFDEADRGQARGLRRPRNGQTGKPSDAIGQRRDVRVRQGCRICPVGGRWRGYDRLLQSRG